MTTIKQSITIVTPKTEIDAFERRIEKIGRVCYKSEHKITADSSEKFVRGLIKRGHESVLEHANISIMFTTDRATSQALCRHRHTAISQESTHYIDYTKEPLVFIEPVGMSDSDKMFMHGYFSGAETMYKQSPLEVKMRRMMFPLALKTDIIITTNIREWRHMIKIRTASGVHPQMNDLMSQVLIWFKSNYPIYVEDIAYDV